VHRHDLSVLFVLVHTGSMATKKRGPKSPMTDEHKAALSAGRNESASSRTISMRSKAAAPSGAANARPSRSRNACRKSTRDSTTPIR
jgi:hypothetical protein